MRELTRCIMWTIGIGAPALLVAAWAHAGLAQADGAWAWLVFLVYGPFYLVVDGVAGGAADPAGEPAFLAAAFAAQFLYFFAWVAVARYLHRKL